MATTGQNFVLLKSPASVGDTYQASGTVATYLPPAAQSLINSVAATALDTPGSGFASDGFAKHGYNQIALTGTTPINLSLIDLTSNAVSSAGDTVFATWNTLELYNTGAADVTVKTGASNGATLPLNGTSPTITVPANSKTVLRSTAGVAIDSSHTIVTVTPTAGGSFALGVAGA